MKQIILIVGSPLGNPDVHNHRYLSLYDPHVGEHGRIESTHDIDQALVFADAGEAVKCWRQINKNHPLRPDGKPNRPLTAYTVELVNLP